MAESSGSADKLHFEHCNQDGDDRHHSNRRELREDPFLRMVINSIMRKAVHEPHNAMITPDARETLRACVTRFTTFITSKAEQKCTLEERELVTGDDIFYAMSTAGVYHYMKDVNRSLRKYRSGPIEKKGEGLITNRSGQASLTKKEQGKQSAAPELVAPKCMPQSIFVAYRQREPEDSAVPRNATPPATAPDREKLMWTLWLSTLVAKGWGVPILPTEDYEASTAAPPAAPPSGLDLALSAFDQASPAAPPSAPLSGLDLALSAFDQASSAAHPAAPPSGLDLALLAFDQAFQ